MTAPWPKIEPIPKLALPAWRRLSEALEDYSPPCTADPELWFSGRSADTEAAAWRCRGCSAFVECGDFASSNDERDGVWAGVDRSERRADAA